MKLLASILLLSIAQCGFAVKWRVCDDASDYWQPTDVKINPDPAVAGQDVAFEIGGVSDRVVTGGYLVASVTYEGMPIAEEVKELCKRTHCPIEKGPVHVVYGQTLPPFVPPGSYEVQVQLKTQNDELLMCIVVDFDINAPSIGKVVSNLMGGFSSLTK